MSGTHDAQMEQVFDRMDAVHDRLDEMVRKLETLDDRLRLAEDRPLENWSGAHYGGHAPTFDDSGGRG